MLLLALLAAATAQPATPNAKTDPDQKVRCQREDVTGSLIGYKKVCHTVAEWRRMSEEAQAGATRMVDQGNTCSVCGNLGH